MRKLNSKMKSDIPLTEDGSLDVECINALPREQRYKVIGAFTREQFREYISAIPINEGHRQTRPVKFDRPMGVSLNDVIDRIRRK